MKIAPKILNKIPIYLMKLFYDDNLLLPYYHTISDIYLPHIKNLYNYRTIKEFRDDLEYFLGNHSPISLDELIDIKKNGKKNKRKMFFLSFDDGMSEIYFNIAPVLKEMGIPATFFLCADFIDNNHLFYRHKTSLLIEKYKSLSKFQKKEVLMFLSKNKYALNSFEESIKLVPHNMTEILDLLAEMMEFSFLDFLKSKAPYLTTEQVRSLQKDGFTIGAHSINHPLYSTISIYEQLVQTRKSLKFISEGFDQKTNTFAFPFNDNCVTQSFFRELFRMENFDLSFGTSGFLKETVKYNLQRFSMEEIDGTAEYIIKYHSFAKFKNILKRKSLIIREK